MIDDCTDRNNLIEIQRLETKKVKGHGGNIYQQHGLRGTLFVALRIAFMTCVSMRTSARVCVMVCFSSSEVAWSCNHGDAKASE